MNMKLLFNKKLSLIFALLITLLLFGCGGQSNETGSESSGDEVVLQIGHAESVNDTSVHNVMSELFAEKVESKSNGSIKVEIVGNGQLGGEREMVEGMQLGTIDMASTANLILGNFDSRFMVLDLPYLFEDYEAAYKVLDSDVMQEVYDSFVEKGIRVLAVAQGGFRTVVGDRAIRQISDFDGMKIRVPENDLYLSAFSALQANPTPMNYNEVFTALQQNTIDGFEIVVPVVLANKYYEVSEYISLTNHFFSPNPLMISEQKFQSLTEDQQNILVEAAQEAADEERLWVEEQEELMLIELEEKGMKVIKDVNMEEMRNAVQDIYKEFEPKIGEDLLNSVLELTSK